MIPSTRARKIGIGIVVALASAVLIAQPVAGKPAAQARTAITCSWPVGPSDSAKDVLRRFGRQARMADIGVGEGETERGVVLFPNDPRRRIEVLCYGPTRHAPQSVKFVSERAPWTVAGIRLGDSLESVSRRNGRAMNMQMFGADYGGTVHSFNGGKLEKVMGACEPSIVFSPTAGTGDANSLSGDGVVESDHPDMAKARPYVSILGVHFPAPTD